MHNRLLTKDPLEDYYQLDSEMFKLEIKQSTLPFSGMGLFAAKDIGKTQIISEYYGSVMRSQNSMDKQFCFEDKMVLVDNSFSVISRGPASRANDIVRWEPQNYNSQLFKVFRKKQTFPQHTNYFHNAKISIQNNQKAFLRATKDITAGEQIFIDYGFEYWDFFYKQELKSRQC